MIGRFSVVGSLLVVLCGSLVGSAQPAGLAPGDTYHVVFVTSGLTNISSDRTLPPSSINTFGGIPAADWVSTFFAASTSNSNAFGLSSLHFTTGDPNGPAWDFVTPQWQAILSGPSQNDAITSLNVTAPIYNTNGELVATDTADLFDGGIGGPIKYDEFGNEVTGDLDVWSGTTASGFWTGNSCSQWDDPSSSNSADVGGAGDVAGSWIEGGALNCNQSARLYALSPELTVLQPGDVDGDLDVDGADFLLWQQGKGTSNARRVDGDLDGDAAVDHDDLTVWDDNYVAAPPLAASTAVPEPSTAVLLIVLAGSCVVGRNEAPYHDRSSR